MNSTFALIALCAGVLTLSACDRTPTTASTPMVNQPVPTASGVMAGPATDPSLPSATPANAANVDATPGRPDGTISPAQEAMKTPIPGQNNDHSAPKAPTQAASTPS